MSKNIIIPQKMRVSFDLDEVLFVNAANHETERILPHPLRYMYKERLRYGAPRLINELQSLGYEVWVYTTSFRSEHYIRSYFALYNIHFDGIVNGQRHQKEVQGNRKEPLPMKLPNRYKISLHIDDEEVVASYGREYGFDVYQLNAQDDEWVEKILAYADKVRHRKFPNIQP